MRPLKIDFILPNIMGILMGLVLRYGWSRIIL